MWAWRWCQKIVSTSLMAKVKAYTLEVKARANAIGPEAKSKAIKIWPLGTLGPRPGLDDYITDSVLACYGHSQSLNYIKTGTNRRQPVCDFNPLWAHQNCRAARYSNPVIATLAIELMGELLRFVKRGVACPGWRPTQSPPCCTKCNSPPANGQCTKFILIDVVL